MNNFTILILAGSLCVACDTDNDAATGSDAQGTTTGSRPDLDPDPGTALVTTATTTTTGSDPSQGGDGETTSGSDGTASSSDGTASSSDGTASSSDGTASSSDGTTTSPPGDSTGESPGVVDPVYASVTSVAIDGDAGSYTFGVGVFSPDTGCDQYADWWEIVSEDGELILRRIMSHSHVPPVWKQPFVRWRGVVPVTSDQVVIVRAHMNTSGFGPQTFRGSIDTGFEPYETALDFASDLELVPPQPGVCPF